MHLAALNKLLELAFSLYLYFILLFECMTLIFSPNSSFLSALLAYVRFRILLLLLRYSPTLLNLGEL